MEEAQQKRQQQQEVVDALTEKGIDIDEKVTPEEARVIVYKLAKELWGDDQTLIKKNLTIISKKAMKMFGGANSQIDNAGFRDLGRGKRKKTETKFRDALHETEETESRQEANLMAKKQKIQRPDLKPNIPRFQPPAEENPRQPSPMPEDLKSAIVKSGVGLNGLTFLIEKALTLSDMNRNLSRLLLPLKQMKAEFLNKEEQQVVARMVKMTVKLVEPTLSVPEIGFNRWEMKKSNNKATYSYVLITSWNTVKDKNRLQENHIVQVWAFRTADQQLGIALAKLPNKEQILSTSQH